MLQIYTYGVLFTLGIVAGLYYFWKMGRSEHLPEISLFDAFFISLLMYFLIGRGAYALLNGMELQGAVAILSHPGIHNFFGSIGAALSMMLISKIKGWELAKMMDLSAVSFSVMMIFVSLGGLINRNNPGREIPWGISYPGTGKVFPIDLLSVISAVIIFVIVYRVRKNFRFYGWYKGEKSVAPEGLAALVLLLLLGVYYALRFFVESSYPYLMLMLSLILLAVSSVMIYIRSGKRKR